MRCAGDIAARDVIRGLKDTVRGKNLCQEYRGVLHRLKERIMCAIVLNTFTFQPDCIIIHPVIPYAMHCRIGQRNDHGFVVVFPNDATVVPKACF